MTRSVSGDGRLASSRKEGNRFLDALPHDIRAELLGRGQRIAAEAGEVVAERDTPIRAVYFPYRGAISEIEELWDGGAAEVTVVGDEGFSPVEALLDEPVEQRRRLVQISTVSLVVSVADAIELKDRSDALCALVRRYAVASLRVSGVGIACNARHPVTVRLARWLLRMHDRAHDDHFRLTHEVSSIMLGVRRPTVTLAIGELVAGGAIASARGAVQIVDRAKLESYTCRCYYEGRAAIERVYASLP